MNRLRLILRIMGDDKSKLPGLFVLFLFNACLDLLGIALIGPFLAIVADPAYFQQSSQGSFINSLISDSTNVKLEIFVGAAICSLALIKSVVGIFNGWLITRFCQLQQASLRVKLLDGYLKLNYLKFISRESSDYLYVCSNLTSDYIKVLSVVLKLLAEFIVALFLLAFLAYSNVAVFSVMAIVGIMAVLTLDLAVRKPLVTSGLQVNELMKNAIKTILEALELTRIIKTFHAETFFVDRAKQNMEALARVFTLSEVLNDLPRHIFESFITIFIVVMVFYSLVSGGDTRENIALIAVYGFAGVRLFPLVKGASSALNQIRYRTATLDKLNDDLVAIEKMSTATNTEQKSQSSRIQSIKLESIKFEYDGSKNPVIDGANFAVNSGEIVGIIGKSGQGKTTFLNIVLGLFEAFEGSTKINEKRLSIQDYKNLRYKIGFVSQDLGIFNDTLRNNILLGASYETSKARYEQALTQANVSEFMFSLPAGDRTLLGERGARLSGGQQQRVAIARALFHGRSFFVFDEPTSALDARSEAQILSTIKKLSEQFPVILVSHKESSLEICHRIYKIDRGNLVEV